MQFESNRFENIVANVISGGYKLAHAQQTMDVIIQVQDADAHALIF